MSRFNTSNPLGSGSPLDLDDNAKNMDVAVNAEQDTFQDRLGNSRLTWTGIVKAGSGDPAIAVDAAVRAVDAADRAESAESSVEQNAGQIAQDAAQQAAGSVVIAVDGAVDRAENAADRAEDALDATTLIAATKGAYRATTITAAIAQGVSALTVGDTFTAAADNVDYIGLYVIKAGPVAMEVSRLATEFGAEAFSLRTRLGTLAPVVGGSLGQPLEIDTVNETLTIPGASIIKLSTGRHQIGSPYVIDLTAASNNTKVVFFDTRDNSFAVRNYNVNPSKLEESAFVPVAFLRKASLGWSVSINGPHTVDGRTPTIDPMRDYIVSIMTPFLDVSTERNFPSYQRGARTLTFWKDTMLLAGNKRWLLPSDQVVTFTGNGAQLLFWDTLTDTLVTRVYNQPLNRDEAAHFALVATVRDASIGSGSHYRDVPAGISMMCPYTVDGSLFGIDLSGLVIENRPGAAIEGIRHACGMADAPANTLAAVRESVRRGFYVMEHDICWTSDNVPVVIHGPTVDPSTDGTGNVADKTLAEIKLLDAGTWFDPAFAGEEVPTFEEILRLAKRLDLTLVSEIKPAPTVSQVQGLLALVRKTGMGGRIEFQSFDKSTLDLILAEDVTQQVGLVTDDLTSSSADMAATLKTATNVVTVAARHIAINQSQVDYARSLGLRVTSWTVNTEGVVRRLASYGIDGITSDGLNIADILRSEQNI